MPPPLEAVLKSFDKSKNPKEAYEALLNNIKIVRQPPTFFRKSFLNGKEFVKNEFHYVMDYELWLRLSKQSIPLMVNEPFSVFRIHADQKTSSLNKLKFIEEESYLLKREGVSWIRSQIVLYPDYKTLVKTIVKVILIKLGLMDKKYANISYSTRKLSS